MADLRTSRGAGEDRWALTPEALESLLELLGPDPDTAAREYERIRGKLIRIFEWRGCREPEELVDETMNRVAHKLAGGLEVRSEDPFRYFCGVAQMVFKEVLRKRRKRQDAMAEIRRTEPAAFEPETPGDEDDRMVCLRDCMADISDRNRDLILEYYTGDGRGRIRRRKKLADELGIAMNALRIRAYRLRNKLEDCVRDCAAARSALPETG